MTNLMMGPEIVTNSVGKSVDESESGFLFLLASAQQRPRQVDDRQADANELNTSLTNRSASHDGPSIVSCLR